MEAIAVLLGTGIGLLIALPFLVLTVVMYILTGISLSAIAKRRGIANAWMAWVPVAQNFLLGAVADDYSMKKYADKRNLRTILVIISAVSVGGAFIPMVGTAITSVAGLALTVFQLMACYKIYESSKPANAMTYLMLGIFLLGIPTPFLLMSCRNSDDGMPA